MKCLCFIMAVCLIPVFLRAQTGSSLQGMVVDQNTNLPLQGSSMSIYRNGRVSGNITNDEGKFTLFNPSFVDSIKFSMIGYHNKVLNLSLVDMSHNLLVMLNQDAVSLGEVVVRPMSAFEIMQKAIKSTLSMLPTSNFENTSFYREIIKEQQQYFSVAEAILNTQYIPSKKSYKLRLEKGRSKEDVIATRLFEDFHPGGGPQALAELSLNTGFPDFLNMDKMKWFDYRRDSVTSFDGRRLYVIAFDQKEGVYKALEKGSIFIDATDFSLVRYQAVNSPRGMAYVKDLKGTDKLLAELLHIDFKRKGWTKQVDFKKIDDKVVVDHARASYSIAYKQPKKNLDLDLDIVTEFAVTDNQWTIAMPISGGDEWKRKNIIANLPTDFDKDFWGANNIISPTAEVENIIAAISNKNKDVASGKLDSQWMYHQKNNFVSTQTMDSIVIIPVMKSNWDDDETGGMIFRELSGDFVIETAINITKRSNSAEMPDNGFQQSGIIIRNGKGSTENNIILSIGTGGNSTPKFFLRKTENGRSKSTIDKIDAMNGSLKLEKKGESVAAYFRQGNTGDWHLIDTHQAKWLNDTLQAGIMEMARFAGSGPKMKPDMKAVFTGFFITGKRDLNTK